ncbi:MAG: hemin ABC transporter substrate-binding protein [Pseudorhodoplanes sp.]
MTGMASPLCRLAVLLLCAAALLPLRATAGDSAAGDAEGRPADAIDASRTVSIGGSITEILYELGAAQNIVAVDSTSLYPRQALQEKKNVGYMRALSPEGVLGVAPSLILALQGAGPPQAMSVLKAAGVPIIMVGDDYSAEGILRKIERVAKAVQREERGRCVAERVRRDLDTLAQWRAGIGKPVRVVFVMSFVNGRAMVAGRNTAADGIIRMAGAVNAIDQFEGYKQLEDESVVAAQPDAVLAMLRDAEPVSAKQVFAHKGFALTPAAARNAFVAMDGLYLLGFGPRTASAARELAQKLYPDLKAPQTTGAAQAPPSLSCDR